jgi:hypothetical protein
MRQKVTRWWPSHCACSVSFWWDADAPDGQRVHHFHTAHEKCAAHAGIPDGQEFLDILVLENQEHSRRQAEEDAANG